ncbi:MAG TPA: NUDIX domain-containing protein [Candidatus Kapabacteria bacterium]|jgi:dATP pyrophosphohydrolase|nr:NUDIX domain-containing protein [Candidatus Kapabacteria bacterium]
MNFISNTVQVHIFSYNPEMRDYKHLLLKRSSEDQIYPNLWQVITGELNSDEKPLECAMRETMEEIHLQPINKWVVPVVGTFYNYKENSMNFVPIFAFEVKFNDKVMLSKEHSEYKWLDFNIALDYLKLPSHREGLIALDKYILTFDDKLTYAI